MKSKRLSFIFLSLILALTLLNLTVYNINNVKAVQSNTISLSDSNFTVYEAEEFSYIMLSYQGDFESMLPLFAGFTVTGGDAVRGENYTTAEEGKIPIVIYNNMLCLKLTMLKSDEYDSGKTIEFTIFSTDDEKFAVSGLNSAVLTFKDQNPDGFISVVSEDITVYENEVQTFFTVQVSPNYFGAEVNLVYAGTAVNGEDFFAPVNISIPAGILEYDVPVILYDDNEKQINGRVVQVYLDSCGRGSEIAAIPNNTTITIKDDESRGVISFLLQTDEVVEQDGDYALFVCRIGGTEGVLSFNIEMITSADLAIQYENNPSGAYEFADGEATKIIRLKLIEDKIYTGDETFAFTITTDAQTDINSLVLTREDSILLSQIYILGGSPLIRSTDGGTYSLQVYKTEGYCGNFKMEITMESWNTSIIESYSQGQEIPVDGSNLDQSCVYNFYFNTYTDGAITGQNNKIYIRFYDLNDGVNVNGINQNKLEIDVIDLVDYGKYRLKTPTREGDLMYFDVETLIPSKNTVDFTLTFRNKDTNQILLEPIAFQISGLAIIGDNLIFNISEYTSLASTVIATLTSANSYITFEGDTSYEFDIAKGSGGTVGIFAGTNKLYENSNNGNITLYRNNAGIAIDVPIYIKNGGIYFAQNDIVAIAHFDIGQYETSVFIAIPDNNTINSPESNILYICEGDLFYVITGTIGDKAVKEEFNITIYNDDDYGKAGFTNTLISAKEGDETTLQLYIDGGIDTPVSLYIIETNLPDTVNLDGIITISKESGYNFSFTYDDLKYFNNTNAGYIKFGIRLINKGGVITGKETATVVFEDNDLGANIGICDKYGNLLTDDSLIVTFAENYSGTNYGTLYVSLYNCDNWEGVFAYRLNVRTKEGSDVICNAEYSGNIHKGEILKFDYYFNYTQSSGDNVFYIMLNALGSNTGIVAISNTLQVTVTNTVPQSNITAEENIIAVYENEEEAEITLIRSYNDYDLVLSITDYNEKILAGFNIYINNVILSQDTFTWQAGQFIKIKLVWENDSEYTANRNINLLLSQAGNNPFTYGGATVLIYDDELNAEIEFEDTLIYTQDNPYTVYPEYSSNYVEYRFDVDVSQLIPYIEIGGGYYIYYDIIPVNDSAHNNFDALLSRYYTGWSYVNGYSAVEGKAKLFGYVTKDGNYTEPALYKIIITGCSYNISINSEDKRTVYLLIKDDDAELNVFGANSIYQHNDNINIDIKRIKGFEQTVNVQAELDEEALNAGFTLSINNFDLNIGENFQNVTITAPVNKYEGNTITVTITYSSQTLTGIEYTYNIRVLKSEDYTFSLQQDITVTEGNDVRVKILRTAGTGTASVDYTITNYDDRYSGETEGRIVFNSGETEKYITLLITNDKINNLKDNLIITLSNALGGVISGNDSTIITIIDNDTPLSDITSSSFNEVMPFTVFGDFDEDGLKDVFGIMQDGTVIIYFNDGINYTKKVYTFKINIPKSVDYGQLDSAEGLDIVLLYDDEIAIIYINKFRDAVCNYYNAQCIGAEKICVGDIDNDNLDEVCFVKDNINISYFDTDSSTGDILPVAKSANLWIGMTNCTVSRADDKVFQIGYYLQGALARKVNIVELSEDFDAVQCNWEIGTEIRYFHYNLSTVFSDNNGYHFAFIANANYDLYIDGVKVLSLGSGVQKIYAANIDNDNESELIFLKNGEIFIINQYAAANEYSYSISEAIKTFGYVDDIFVSDLYNTNTASVYYKSTSKLYLIENPYNLTVISFEIEQITVNDCDGYVDIKITRKGSLNVIYTLGVATVNGTAIGGLDFTAFEKNLVFGIRETSKTVRVYILDEDITCQTKDFKVMLFSGSTNIKFDISELVIFITDTDRSGVAQFDENFNTVAENTEEIQIAVIRSIGTHDLTVDYIFSDSEYCSNGEDYFAANGTLTFAPNEYLKYITVNIINNNYYNGSLGLQAITERFFTVELSNVRSSHDYGGLSYGAQIGENSLFKVYITDDETFAQPVLFEGRAIEWDLSEKIDFNNDGLYDSYQIESNKITITFNKINGSLAISSTFSNLLSKYNVTTNNTVKAFYSVTLNQFVLLEGGNYYTYAVANENFISLSYSGSLSVNENIGDYFSACTEEYYSLASLMQTLVGVGDIDGDGKIDFFLLPYDYITMEEYQFVNGQYTGSIFYPVARGYQFATALSGTNYEIDINYTYHVGYDFNANIKKELYIRDLNGDSTDDIVFLYANKNIFTSLSVNGQMQDFNKIEDLQEFNSLSTTLYFVKPNTSGMYDMFMIDRGSGRYNLFLQNNDNTFILVCSGFVNENTAQCRYFDISYIVDTQTCDIYLRLLCSNSNKAVKDYLSGNTDYNPGLNIYYAKLQFKSFALHVGSAVFDEDLKEGYITIYNPSGLADTVYYYFTNGTAINGADYSINGNSVTFSEGELYRTVKVTLFQNNFYDGNKYFNFNIYNSIHKQLILVDSVKIDITDNENCEDINGLNEFYFKNSQFIYTPDTEYDISRLDVYFQCELIQSSNSKSISFTYYTKGIQTFELYGYNNDGQRIFYKTISTNIIDTSGLDILIEMPPSISEDVSVEVKFTVKTETADGVSGYFVNGAEVVFTDPFTLQEITLVTGADGTAVYTMLVTGGDYGEITLAAQVFSYLNSNAGTANAASTIINADGKITGYVLLPDGNIGVSGIRVKQGNKEAVTDQNGYFEIDAVSGYYYNLTINANKQNTFYEETEVSVYHCNEISIISINLEKNVEDSLTFDVSYFYNNYSGAYNESEIFEHGYNDLGNCNLQIQYNIPASESEYKNITDMTFTTGIPDPGSEAKLQAKVPFNTNSYKVQSHMREKKYQNWWESWGPYVSTAFSTEVKSQTNIFFSLSAESIPDLYKNVEFVTCDNNGNTTGVLTNVQTFLSSNNRTRYINPVFNQYPSGEERVKIGKSYNNVGYENYYIMLTLTNGDIKEGERLYIRRVTSNDILYYYTGIVFGRSLAEIVRDDVASQFNNIKTEALPTNFGSLSGLALKLDSSKAEFSLRQISSNRATVFLGYSTKTFEVDCELDRVQKSGSLSVDSVGLDKQGEVGFYFGGIFEMVYDSSTGMWKYDSGDAKFMAHESVSTRLTIEIEICAMISAYVYAEIGSTLESNMTIVVEDGSLTIDGTADSSIYIEMGVGVSIMLAQGEIWGRATGEVHFYYGEQSQGTSLSIRFTGGIHVYFLWFDYCWEAYNQHFTYELSDYPHPQEPIYSTTLEDIERNDYSAYSVTVDSSGVIINPPEQVTDISTATLVEESNINSSPTLLDYGLNKMMVYTQRVTDTVNEYEALLYKIKQDGVWSVPKLVYTGGGNISEYSAIVHNGKPVITFSYTPVSGDIVSMFRKTEIAAAVYNGNSFDIHYITSDSMPDSKPLIASDGENMLITFVKTYRTDYTMQMQVADLLYSSAELNYMMYSVWTNSTFSSPKIARRGVYNMADYDMSVTNGEASFIMLADKDGIIRTSSDLEVLLFKYSFVDDLWSAEENLTNNAVAETAIKVIEVNGETVYLWLNKYGINMKKDDKEAEIINTREHGEILFFTAKAYNGKIALAWTENITNIEESEYKSIYFLIIDEDGNIGIRNVLASTEDVIIDFDILAENESIYYAYSQSHIVYQIEEETVTYDTSYSITGGTVIFAMSASAENVYTASGRLRKDTSETFFFDITNFGQINLNNLKVTVRMNNADGAVLYNATILTLDMGKSKTLSFCYIIPEGMYGVFITVEQGTEPQQTSSSNTPITPKPLALTFNAVTNDSQNNLTLQPMYLGEGDFELTKNEINLGEITSFCLNDKLNLLINVINESNFDCSGTVAVKVFGTDTVLTTKTFEVGYLGTEQVLAQFNIADLYQYADENNTIRFLINLFSDDDDITINKSANVEDIPLPKSYTVAFNTQGGSAIEAITVYGVLMEFPQTPLKEGCIFKGWYIDEELTQKAEIPLMLTADITLYAKWEAESVQGSNLVYYIVAGSVFILLATAVLIILTKKYGLKIFKGKKGGDNK